MTKQKNAFKPFKAIRTGADSEKQDKQIALTKKRKLLAKVLHKAKLTDERKTGE